jgi:ABC-2 type transport system ATP-binding protein
VAIINQGKLVMLENITEMKLKAIHRIEFSFATPVAAEQFANVPGVRSAIAIANRIVCEISGAETEILKKAVELSALTVRTEEPTLDEIFLNLIENGAAK